MNAAEQRFADYLDEHDYGWIFEPDYGAELGLDERPQTLPDFLVSRGEKDRHGS